MSFPSWISFSYLYFLLNHYAEPKKRHNPIVVAPSLASALERLEHSFHCQSHAAVIDEPRATSLTTFSIQCHQGFCLGIRQIGTL